MKSKGRITLPVEKGMDHILADLAEKWGADAVRNSDGTDLPGNIKDLGLEVYSTLSMTRNDQAWAKAHPDQLTQKFLNSDPVTATSDTVRIELMNRWFDQQFQPDEIHDVKKWFEVYDRTLGVPVPANQWSYDKAAKAITVTNAKKFHIYTATFLAYQLWDTTSMYNHLTNHWTTDHVRPMDPRQPETRKHLLQHLEEWIAANPDTDVVRFTSLAYHFTNNFQMLGGEPRSRYRDWTGYHDCTSALALDEFEKEYGYALRPEDIASEGYMCDMNKLPSKQYLDWMDFIQRSVRDIVKEWVDIVHRHGKKAMMFYCDHWIGSEPYGKYFAGMGLDSIVNPCGCGMEVRRITDIPGNIEKELRLYPYFFPVNAEGKPNFPDGDPVGDCKKYWRRVRRALIQNPADRIGFGGYLSLAATRPDFLDYVGELAEEFREIHAVASKHKKSKAPFKVAFISAWGKLRSWIDEDLNDWTKPYQGGIIESLSGMNIDVDFISFDDVLEKGVPADVNVLINTGDANTSWSGGEYWKGEKLTTIIRQWVYETGGAFVGLGEPTAHQYQGHFFQLFDVLGVDREMGYGKSTAPLPYKTVAKHFILGDAETVVVGDFKNRKDRVFVTHDSTQVLLNDRENVLFAVNTYGRGRVAYLTALPFTPGNTRLLLRLLYWVAGKEGEFGKWHSTNVNVECTAFPDAGKLIVLNNSYEEQKTVITNDKGRTAEVVMEPFKSKWFDIGGMFQI